VQENDGIIKFCIDYKQWKKFTVNKKYTFPRIDDFFDQMRGSKVFFNIDLRSGHYQVNNKEECIH
jgi:hypothetical protein